MLLISQPAHAWVTGQMARQWGNEQFVTLMEEVCLAAEQHDIGFRSWEEAPTWDRSPVCPQFQDLRRERTWRFGHHSFGPASVRPLARGLDAFHMLARRALLSARQEG